MVAKPNKPVKYRREDCLLHLTVRVDMTNPKEVNYFQALMRNFDIVTAKCRPGYMFKRIMGEHEVGDGLLARLAKLEVREKKRAEPPASPTFAPNVPAIIGRPVGHSQTCECFLCKPMVASGGPPLKQTMPYVPAAPKLPAAPVAHIPMPVDKNIWQKLGLGRA